MTLAELGQRMTNAELVLWMAEYNREPWGELRQDLRMGRVCEVTVNSHNAKAKTRPKDFLFKWEREAAKTPDQMKAACQAWVAAMNAGADARKGRG